MGGLLNYLHLIYLTVFDPKLTKNIYFQLTPEDEERRRRRRERNKIAATKCRMKKRERTVNLVTESEVLENQNIDLKAQLKVCTASVSAFRTDNHYFLFLRQNVDCNS